MSAPKEYEVEIVDAEAHPWKSSFGQMMGYKVKLSGFNETVTINKKMDSDPPRVGDKVFGNITSKDWGNPEGDVIKFYTFKSASRPYSGPSGGSKHTEQKFLKDTSDVPFKVWQTLVNIQGVPNSSADFTKFFETVKNHADELLARIDQARRNNE